jgi:hypothetical protein
MVQDTKPWSMHPFAELIVLACRSKKPVKLGYRLTHLYSKTYIFLAFFTNGKPFASMLIEENSNFHEILLDK